METKINAVYVRVSTEKQDCEMQMHAIKQFLQSKGILIYQIYEDVGESGGSNSRPALNQLLNDVNAGKVESLCVYGLDRLFRSLKHLIETLNQFQAMGVKFRSVREAIDLSTPQGVFMVQLLGAFGEFERNLISQRTKAGMASAKAKGIHCGAPSTISKTSRLGILMGNEQGLSLRTIAAKLKISHSTVRRVLADTEENNKLNKFLGYTETPKDIEK